MLLILILVLHLQIIISDVNISDTNNGIKVVENYRNDSRYPRCIDFSNLKLNFGNLIKKSVDTFENPQSYIQFPEYLNISDCSRSASEVNSAYSKLSIADGLLVHGNVSDEHWEQYKSTYNKNYFSLQHEAAAFEKWRENLEKVVKHNQQYLAGKLSYSLHLNHFGDLHITDYFRKILKLMPTIRLFDPAEDHHRTSYRRSKHHRLPKKVDWRSAGFSPRREQQWQCGACYAFAVAHAVQAQLFRKHGRWHELSPQQIVDCSGGDGNLGCDGGSLRAALRYAARDGLMFENNYPYVGKRGRCKYARTLVAARPARWATLPRDEAALERALLTIGPLAVAVNAAPFTFQLYRSGVYDDPFCTPWTMNHAMLLVGYSPDYWLLLNWWGRDWGEDGYIRIRRGFNRCGVANMATYVEL